MSHYLQFAIELQSKHPLGLEKKVIWFKKKNVIPFHAFSP